MPSLVGSVIPVALPATGDSGNITVPGGFPVGANAFVAFSTYFDGTGQVVTSLTGTTITTQTLRAGGSSGSMGGILAWGKINSSGAATVRMQKSGSYSEGPTLLIQPITVADPDNFRVDDAYAFDQPSGPITLNISSNSGHLVIGFNGCDGGGTLGAVSGYTQSGAEQVTNADKSRCYTANSPGASTTSMTGPNNGYPTAALISIQDAGGTPPPVVTVDPTNQTVTEPATANFTVTATGTGLSYQWEVSTNGGGSWGNVASGTGGTTNSYTTPATNVGMDGYLYRCVVTNSGGSDTSASAELTVNPAAGSPPTVDTHPSNQTVTEPATASFSAAFTGETSIQWLVDKLIAADPATRTPIIVGTAQNPGAQAITVPATAQAFVCFAMYGSTGGSSSLSSLACNFTASGTIAFTQLPGGSFGAGVMVGSGVVNNTSGGRTFTPAFNRTNEVGCAFYFVFLEDINPADFLIEHNVGQMPDGSTPATAAADSDADSLVIGFDVRAGAAPAVPGGWTDLGSTSFTELVEVGLRLRQLTSPGDPESTITSNETSSSVVGIATIKRAGLMPVVGGTGATTENYTTPATDVSMDGWEYAARATNTDGSVTTNRAILTVNPGGGGGSPPEVTVTDTNVSGQSVTVEGTYLNSVTSASITIPAATPANGAVTVGPVAVPYAGGNFSVTLDDLVPGSYDPPEVTMTNGDGSDTGFGEAFEILGIGGDPDSPIEAAHTETGNAVETSNRSLTASKSQSDSGTAVETSNRLLSMTKAQADSGTVSETTNRTLSAAKTQTDSGAAVETTDRTLAASKAQADSGAAVDTSASSMSSSKSQTDTGAAVDTVNGVVSKSSAQSDVGVALDTVASSMSASKTQTDSGTAVETTSASTGKFSAQADVAEAEDASSTELIENQFNKEQSDTGSAVETTTSTISASKTQTDSGVAVETVDRSMASAKSQTDSGTAVETTAAQLVGEQTEVEQDDSGTAVETTTGAVSKASATVETLSALETLTRSLAASKIQSEVLALQDSSSSAVSGLAKTHAETGNAVDTASAVLGLNRGVLEVAALQESIGASMMANRTLVEVLNAVDTSVGQINKVAVLVEDLDAQDASQSFVITVVIGGRRRVIIT